MGRGRGASNISNTAGTKREKKYSRRLQELRENIGNKGVNEFIDSVNKRRNTVSNIDVQRSRAVNVETLGRTEHVVGCVRDECRCYTISSADVKITDSSGLKDFIRSSYLDQFDIHIDGQNRELKEFVRKGFGKYLADSGSSEEEIFMAFIDRFAESTQNQEAEPDYWDTWETRIYKPELIHLIRGLNQYQKRDLGDIIDSATADITEDSIKPMISNGYYGDEVEVVYLDETLYKEIDSEITTYLDNLLKKQDKDSSEL